MFIFSHIEQFVLFNSPCPEVFIWYFIIIIQHFVITTAQRSECNLNSFYIFCIASQCWVNRCIGQTQTNNRSGWGSGICSVVFMVLFVEVVEIPAPASYMSRYLWTTQNGSRKNQSSCYIMMLSLYGVWCVLPTVYKCEQTDWVVKCSECSQRQEKLNTERVGQFTI